MAIGSINMGRVTSTLKTESLLASLRRNTAELFVGQNRLASGRRFSTPSEDPGGAARVLNMSEILGEQSQFIKNIRHASNTLDATDSAMADVSALIIDAQAIASQNIGSLASAEERAASAELIAAIRNQLVAVGNRTFDGRYLFAGRDTDKQPFIETINGVRYVGDTGDIFARTDVDELTPINLPGNVLFGALSSQVQGRVDLNPIVAAETRLEDLNGATQLGVRRGSFQIVEDGAAGVVTIDITSADTAGDVVDLINEAATAAGAGFTAALTNNGLTINPVATPISIRDISTGATAGDLGITTAAPTSAAVVGGDLGVSLSRTTPLAALMDGAGLDVSAGLTITNGNASTTIDLSTATSIQDILNAIDNSGMSVKATVNDTGTGINVINMSSGSDVTIGENGGTVASALGIRTMDLDIPLASLNNGRGVRIVDGETDLLITAKNGTSFEVNLDGLLTVGEVVDAINIEAAGAGVGILADLQSVGTGIRLTDSTGGTGPLSAGRANLSFAIDDLGLTGTVADPETVIVSRDVNGARANGVLTALYDLERALLADDSQLITFAAEDVDKHLVGFNEARGIVGARGKSMRDRQVQTESAVFATEQLMSEIRDLDYTEAVTRFQQAQTALQASLLTGSQLLNTSLLDFLR
ncbi:MAG: flagellar hook-associated protein 3 [Planctomycetes bacterium]|nr:flagellar hook-associated protein 3 [Planctomycetota bacterium]